MRRAWLLLALAACEPVPEDPAGAESCKLLYRLPTRAGGSSLYRCEAAEVVCFIAHNRMSCIQKVTK